MSTIVAVKKNGVAVIGADTMTKFGGIKESADYLENHSKIVRIGKSYIAYVGHASFGLVLENYFARRKSTPRLDSPQNVFKFSSQFHNALKDDYFLKPHENKNDEFESSQIHCLIANVSGIFGLDSLRSVEAYAKFYSFGSGFHLALGAMHAVYDKVETAEEIARAGLAAAVEFDDCSGLPLELYTIKLKTSKAKNLKRQ